MKLIHGECLEEMDDNYFKIAQKRISENEFSDGR